MTRRYGQIIRVSEDEIGSALVTDTAAGASELTVRNAADFDEDRGGKLSINGQTIAYTKVDDDTGLITLDGTLAADADEGDQVALYDTKRDTIVVEKTALVEVGEGKSDAIHATVAAHLVRQLPEGPRGDDGESVVIERDEDGDWTVIDVLGLGDLAASGLQFWDKDTFNVTEPGDQEFELTHPPADGSLHVLLWGWYTLQRDEFTLVDRTVTFTDPDGDLEVGDIVDFKYAYTVGISTQPGVTTQAMSQYHAHGAIAEIIAADGSVHRITEINDANWDSGVLPAQTLGWFKLGGASLRYKDGTTGDVATVPLSPASGAGTALIHVNISALSDGRNGWHVAVDDNYPVGAPDLDYDDVVFDIWEA